MSKGYESGTEDHELATEDHADQARKLTNSLLEGIGNVERQYCPTSLDIFVADVEADIDRLNLQLSYCYDHRLSYPCLDDFNSGPVPLDMTFVVEMFLWSFDSFSYHSALELLRRNASFFDNWQLRYSEYSADEVVGFLNTRLFDFLTTRFSARQSNISTRPGLPFRVITQRHGLRVHYSPSYAMKPSRVFGSPTSPVDSWIQPGKWKFGAVGPNFKLRFDPADFDVPPLTEAHLVNI